MKGSIGELSLRKLQQDAAQHLPDYRMEIFAGFYGFKRRITDYLELVVPDRSVPNGDKAFGRSVDYRIRQEYEKFGGAGEGTMPYQVIDHSPPNRGDEIDTPAAWVALGSQSPTDTVQAPQASCQLDIYNDIPPRAAFLVEHPAVYLVATNNQGKRNRPVAVAKFVQEITNYPGRWSLRVQDSSGVEVLAALTASESGRKLRKLSDPSHMTVEVFGNTVDLGAVHAAADGIPVVRRPNENAATAPLSVPSPIAAPRHAGTGPTVSGRRPQKKPWAYDSRASGSERPEATAR